MCCAHCVSCFEGNMVVPRVGLVTLVDLLSLTQAEEITLTIGQAFDLAYKKFLESGGKDVETRKQIGTLQKRVRSASIHSR